jgi:hypothetical protein
MTVLSESDRFKAWAEYMYAPELITVGPLLKTDLRAAVDALDDFLEANSAAINAAIPQPARGILTLKQKALLLMYVVARRFNVEI